MNSDCKYFGLTSSFQRFLAKYPSSRADDLLDCISVLCSKGIPNGCFQDYELLSDLLCLLDSLVCSVRGDTYEVQ